MKKKNRGFIQTLCCVDKICETKKSERETETSKDCFYPRDMEYRLRHRKKRDGKTHPFRDNLKKRRAGDVENLVGTSSPEFGGTVFNDKLNC